MRPHEIIIQYNYIHILKKIWSSTAEELLILKAEKQQSSLALLVRVNSISTRILYMLKNAIGGDPSYLGNEKYHRPKPRPRGPIHELT